MKPHPRIRKTIKWGGVAVTLLLVLVWIGSGWAWLYWHDRAERGFSISNGRIALHDVFSGHTATECGSGLGYGWHSERFRIEWSLGHDTLPLWIPVLGATIAWSARFQAKSAALRRAHAGHCPKCNYNRAGLGVDAKCPECGSPPAS